VPRSPLITCRGFQVASDVPAALAALERAAKDTGNLRLVVRGRRAHETRWGDVEADPGPTGQPPHLSMIPAGRELCLRVEILDYEGPPRGKRCAEITALWSLAVPLGFVPWQRFPLEGPHEDVFHYFGPWASIIDSLHGEGRGEEAWPSACAAAQVDVGMWEGDGIHVRGIQTNLHRLGIHCGPVDGVFGRRTEAAIRALGVAGTTSEDLVPILDSWREPVATKNETVRGQITIPGRIEAFPSGGARTIRTRTGFAVAVDGPGRITLVMGEH